MTACRYSTVPGHVCTGPVHLYLSGRLCATAAPPTQPEPPAGTTLADLRAARGLPQAPAVPSWTVLDDRAVASGKRRSSARVFRQSRDAESARKATAMTTDNLGPDFGPQSEHVSALLARARALTETEQARLIAGTRLIPAEVRDAKRAVSERMGWRDPHTAVAAIRTHLDRAPDPDRHGALFAAWRHGFHQTKVPILCDLIAWTALALAGRDVLPGDAYEVLTRPWAQVVGRAHPDDVRTLEDSMFPAGVAR